MRMEVWTTIWWFSILTIHSWNDFRRDSRNNCLDVSKRSPWKLERPNINSKYLNLKDYLIKYLIYLI